MLKDNLFLLSLGVLIVIVLIVLGAVLYFATRRSAAKPGSDPKLNKLRFDSLRSSFRHAVELIEGNIAARSERYSVPWVIVLNEGSDRRHLPIEQSGVASALSSEAASVAAAQGISWHFFDRGIVIDIKGAYLGSPDDEDAGQKPWDEFLGMCQAYRPQRPFDSVVLTVPANLLMDENPDARLELAKRAKLAHRRLWLAQNRFAMRFAVYIAVSDCEQIEGFAPFARSLPDIVRASMLGWSSPYDLATTYRAEWVGEAMDGIVKTVSDTSAEMFALHTAPKSEASKFFLLPSRLAALQGQLQLYVDELMRPSAYHEPFFFRGIYFTGDSTESSQKAAALQFDDMPGRAEEHSPAEGPPSDLLVQLMRQPAFLRDLFEKKVFSEYGLARPSRTQQLSRPVLTRTARWAAIIVLGGWGIGLAVATVQLQRRNTDLVAALAQIQADADYRARAAERGDAVPADWYRRKALALLGAIERLGTDVNWSVFMPGSWPVFDDLDDRVAERVDREFGEIAIATLRRELYARANELTGVLQDNSTGELVIGGECTAPAGFSAIAEAPRRVSLAVEDQPEFAAMVQYVSAVERLDQAILAMVRLQRPHPEEGEDLRLLVKYTLGADPPGNIARSIRFFRRQATAAGAGVGGISVTPIQQAVRCTFVKGMNELDVRMFVNNDLLLSEQVLFKQSLRLFAADAAAQPYSQTVEGYQEVLAAIKDQEALLATGKGGWMRQASLTLGQAYDRVLQRAGQTRLLGPDAVDRARQNAQLAFQRFSGEFSSRFGSASQAGVVWLDKEARFALSPDRVALRDALTALLNQPFMVAPRARELPETSSNSAIVWDAQRLDQALALSEVRKRYVAEMLSKFPLSVRTSVENFVNAHFARLVQDHVAEALSVGPRPDASTIPDLAAFDGARTRLLKVQSLLGDLNDRTHSDNLRGLISRDALGRLRQVDDNLTRSDLYSGRGRDLRSWSGEKGPLLQAFGVLDAPGMIQYLGQQFTRVEMLGRQAEVYMASLDGAATGSPLAQRWIAINRDLERYRLKSPNSSLVSLEQFLVTVGAEADRNNCLEKLAGKAPGSRPSDYFAERHLQLYSALQARCAELQLRDQQELWASFSGNFNRLLAGRLPFSQAMGRDALVADFEDVGQSLKQFDRAVRVVKELPAAAPAGATAGANTAAGIGANARGGSAPGQAARRFAEQFERVRTFLAPLYPTEDGVVAGYDVTVEFRANQAAEIEGSKVIDWTLEIGSQALRLRDTARSLRWEPGMPITLTLRLAKDSPVLALADPQQPLTLVDNKTVSFRFSDPWALLTMIQRQREPDISRRSDGRSQLLRMEFPLGYVAADLKTPPVEGRSRVYLRLMLSPVGKRTPLLWPGAFPTQAPEWIVN